MVCAACKEEAERTNHLDLYSTYRSIIFGCEHSIEDLKRDVDEQVRLAQEMRGKQAGLGISPRVVKHSKIEFKEGRFLVTGDKLLPKKRSLKTPSDLAPPKSASG